MNDLWSQRTDAVARAVHDRDAMARRVDSAEARLRDEETLLVKAEVTLRTVIAALHDDFPELWRFAPPIDVTRELPRLCSQCGEAPAVMVKVGTADGWCVDCLNAAAEAPAAGFRWTHTDGRTCVLQRSGAWGINADPALDVASGFCARAHPEYV